MLFFKILGIVWDLSIVRVNYKLMKRTTKTKKIENSLKILKMFIINFKTSRYKLFIG